MKRNNPNWKPSPKTAKILDLAIKHVKSVPYKVSLRWVFYRLLQEGIYRTKNDYHNQFKDHISRARHTFYDGWKPDILADDSRSILWHGIGAMDEKKAIDNITCDLDKFQNQDYFLMLLYEAKAMTGQFEHYTQHIPLIPFGGDPSIPFKYETAMVVGGAAIKYDLPVVLLYFGDYDKKGQEIRDVALADIRRWCPVDFEVIPCGLTLEQALKYDLPENPDKPGQYQWEALTDEQAKEIITTYLSKYQDADKIKEIEEEEKEMVKKWKERLGGN